MHSMRKTGPCPHHVPLGRTPIKKDSELMPRPELFYALKLLSSWPFLKLSFPSAPKTHGSVGPVAIRNTPSPSLQSLPSTAPPTLQELGPWFAPPASLRSRLSTIPGFGKLQHRPNLTHCLFSEAKFWWNGAMPIHLHNVYSCFCSPLAK